MFTDDNGIVRFESSDYVAPLHTALNTALDSVSNALEGERLDEIVAGLVDDVESEVFSSLREAFESGTNENGSFQKLPSGVLICWSGEYSASPFTWFFPYPFVGVPTVSANSYSTGSGAIRNAAIDRSKTFDETQVTFDTWSSGSSTHTAAVSGIAVGWWK